jgi:hypothetical protein
MNKDHRSATWFSSRIRDQEKESQFMTTNDVAKAINRSKDWVLHLDRVGKLSSIRTSSGMRLFSRDEVQRLAEQMAKK